MAKAKKLYVCDNCAYESAKWLGRCPNCGEWNTFTEKEVLPTKSISASIGQDISSDVVNIRDIKLENDIRTPTLWTEVDFLLGGGILNGQVILLSGEPGVGKSTILIQLANHYSLQGSNTLYVSGEESTTQISHRAQRLFEDLSEDKLHLLSSGNLSSIESAVEKLNPRLVIIDSVQTIYNPEIATAPGTISQIKLTASRLINSAKAKGFTLVIVGHINKEGTIAGPKTLEHMVDTVVQLDKAQDTNICIMRVSKNRFGPTGEIALLVLEEKGFRDISVTDSLFAGDNQPAVGMARSLVWEGSRPVILQVQALVQKTIFAYPKRVAEGIGTNRVQLIAAIVGKYLKIDLNAMDIYIRTTNGFRLSSPAGDMAVAAAIISSVTNKELNQQLLFTGELGLNGKFALSSDRLNDKSNRFETFDVVSPKGKASKRVENLQDLAKLIK